MVRPKPKMSRIAKEEEEYTQPRQTRNSENLNVCVYIHTYKHFFFLFLRTGNE